jgi:hypothetical protein
MSDENERSVASAGSQPVAWAVLRIDGSVYDVYRYEEEAKAIDEVVTGNHGVVPLCRSPALTEEERGVLSQLGYETGEWDKYSNGRPWFVTVKDAAIIRGLLERTQ